MSKVPYSVVPFNEFINRRCGSTKWQTNIVFNPLVLQDSNSSFRVLFVGLSVKAAWHTMVREIFQIGLLYFAKYFTKYFAKYFAKQSILHMNITDCFETCERHFFGSICAKIIIFRSETANFQNLQTFFISFQGVKTSKNVRIAALRLCKLKVYSKKLSLY